MLKRANVKETEIEGMKVLVDTHSPRGRIIRVDVQIDTPHGLFTMSTKVGIQYAEKEVFTEHMAQEVLSYYNYHKPNA